jgi:hypothetical protein
VTDNELLAIVITVLEENLTAWPFPVPDYIVNVQQKEQPETQGVPPGPSVFVEKLFDHVYGSPRVDYKELATPNPNKLLESEEQMYQTTLQIAALSIQDPSQTNLPTASDLASIARAIVQRRSTIRTFNERGLGVLRVTEVRNGYFTNEQDRQEASPSFDVVLTYLRSVPPVEVGKVARLDTKIIIL